MFYPQKRRAQTASTAARRHAGAQGSGTGMTKAALSVYMYGFYLIAGVGLPFIIIPHFTLGMFGMSAGDDVWVRFVGVLSAVIGGFYVAAVLTNTERLFAWSVPARYASATFMATMVALDEIGLALLIFAALDAFAGSITWLAIRADEAEEEAVQAG